MNSNNIYGGGGRRNAMASVDFYRRVPKDLTEVRIFMHICSVRVCLVNVWVIEADNVGLQDIR